MGTRLKHHALVAEGAAGIFTLAAVAEHPVLVVSHRVHPAVAEGEAVVGACGDRENVGSKAADRGRLAIAGDVRFVTAAFAGEGAEGAAFVAAPPHDLAVCEPRESVVVAGGDFQDAGERTGLADRHRPGRCEARVRTRFDAGLAELTLAVAAPGDHLAIFDWP